MLAPAHFELLIRHLDAIDQRVVRRLDRARPWTEPALTSLLCDLLDDETEHEEDLVFSRRELRDALAGSDEALSVMFSIDTIEYLPEFERYVTQSDVGLILNYNDRISGHSWERSWLLQAKRATPSIRERPAYRAKSSIKIDQAQHSRLNILADVLGQEAVKYLLYCPRPSSLRHADRAILAQARNEALSGHIFDYLFGQQVYADAMQGGPTLAAGMLMAPCDAVPSTVQAAHRQLTQSIWPFSWFIAMHVAESGGRQAGFLGPDPKASSDGGRPLSDFLRGDPQAVHDVLRRCAVSNQESSESPLPIDDFLSGRFLPSHVMTIEIAPGGALNDNLREDQ